MTLAKSAGHKTHERVIKVDGDEIKILHVGFEVSDTAWEQLQQLMFNKYKNHKAKSRVMRIMVNAVNLGIIDLDDLEKEIEKKAEKVKDVIYI